jgi:thymidylate synthase ThyX
MKIIYILVLFNITSDGSWHPHFFKNFESYNKCMAEAIAVQFDEENPYNSACMPLPDQKKPEGTPS